MKIDSVGNVQWQKFLGGSSTDIATSIQQTTDGGYIVAGYTYSDDGDVKEKHGVPWCADYWIVKLDATGLIQSQKCLGGDSDDQAYSIQQTPDGGCIIAGASSSHNGDVTGCHGTYYSDYWIVKLDVTDSIQWQKCLGGTIYDVATSIRQTTDGGYIVAGYTHSNDGDVTGFHGGGDDYWIVKIDSVGNIQWQKCLGGLYLEIANSIHQTSDGGYIVAGYSNGVSGDVTVCYGSQDYWIVKLDLVGNIQWQKSLGGSGDDEANCIHQTTDGGYIVAGYSSSYDGDVIGNHGFPPEIWTEDYWIVKIDSVGNIQWQKCLGGINNDEASSIQQTTDGGYVVAGTLNYSYFGSTGDYYIIKITPDLNLVNITNPSGESYCYNAAGVIKVAGNGTTFTVSENGSTTMIAGQKIIFYPGTTIAEGGYLHGYITTDGIYCTNPSNPVVNNPIYDEDILINPMAFGKKEDILLYPNPANEYVFVSSSVSINIQAYNPFGEIVISKKNISTEEIDISDLSPGIYFVELQQNDKREIRKLIIY